MQPKYVQSALPYVTLCILSGHVPRYTLIVDSLGRASLSQRVPNRSCAISAEIKVSMRSLVPSLSVRTWHPASEAGSSPVEFLPRSREPSRLMTDRTPAMLVYAHVSTCSGCTALGYGCSRFAVTCSHPLHRSCCIISPA